jgi:CRP/FNR family transcriptional regulator, cyclic AMP receptor protein
MPAKRGAVRLKKRQVMMVAPTPEGASALVGQVPSRSIGDRLSVPKDFVLRHGWLSQTPDWFRRAVIDQCLPKKIKAGTSVYRVGDPPGGMYALLTGSLGIEIATQERGPYLASIASPGSWFGERAAMTGQPRLVGLRATRDTELLYLPLHAINAIVADDPGAWRLFALVTMGHLDTAITAADDLRSRDHARRFIAVLLMLGGCRLGTPPDLDHVDIDVAHEELATMANVARTTVGTILRDLARAGHLEMSYRRIRILSPDTLRAMITSG